MSARLVAPALPAQVLLLLAASPLRAQSTPPPPADAPEATAVAVAFADSFKQPESALYDAEQDIWFVSNITGPSQKKDGNGFITTLDAQGKVVQRRWSKDQARLDAPKGMAIVGDTLWVADIDALRGFDRRTGAPVASVSLAGMGAAFLNDAAVGPDGAVYLTDTGLIPDSLGNRRHGRPDRIFRIGPDRKASVALESDRLGRPNGIAWQEDESRFLVAGFWGDTIWGWKPGSRDLTPVAVGPGQVDGVVITPAGVVVSSAATSALHRIENGKLVKVALHLPGPADIGFSQKSGLVAVPLLGRNQVVFYRMSPRPGGGSSRQ